MNQAPQYSTVPYPPAKQPAYQQQPWVPVNFAFVPPQPQQFTHIHPQQPHNNKSPTPNHPTIFQTTQHQPPNPPSPYRPSRTISNDDSYRAGNGMVVNNTRVVSPIRRNPSTTMLNNPFTPNRVITKPESAVYHNPRQTRPVSQIDKDFNLNMSEVVFPVTMQTLPESNPRPQVVVTPVYPNFTKPIVHTSITQQKKQAIQQILENCMAPTTITNKQNNSGVIPQRIPTNKNACITPSRAEAKHKNMVSTQDTTTIHPPPTPKIQQKPESNRKIVASLAQSQLLCHNGDNKKARYRSEEAPYGAYCSKCSILMVGKGIRMTQISDPSSREIEIRNLLNGTSELKIQVMAQCQVLESERSKIVEQCKQHQDKIRESYKELYRLLKQFQDKDINKIAYYQEQCLSSITTYKGEFAEALNTLDLIQKDLMPNIQRIKVEVEESQYKHFMQNYMSQIKDIANKLNTHAKSPNIYEGECKPVLISKDISKLSYDVVSLIDYPLGANKKSLYFSFQVKNYQSSDSSDKIKVEDYQVQDLGATLPDTSSPRQRQPGSGRSSPEFKKL